jgi:hypothetical protein
VKKFRCENQHIGRSRKLNPFQKSNLLVKELGLPQLAEYLFYKGSLKFGIVARQTPVNGWTPDFDPATIELKFPWLACPPKGKPTSSPQILHVGEGILAGNYHPFGGDAQPLRFFQLKEPLRHWTAYGDTVEGLDIKWVWEPARFSWAFDLAEYFLASQDEKAPEFFWLKFSEFVTNNPVNLGPNWASAQECALRAITWLMVYPIFKNSKAATPELTQQMALTLWQHAARIPPTLAYARSQHNNHHLSEALGLLVVGSVFQSISEQARNWVRLGQQEFERGLLSQIEPNGTYSQHSANYHRLMLQLALIYYTYTQSRNWQIPDSLKEKLVAATRWVGAQIDPLTGRLPNLGHNDGSLLLGMGAAEFRDYRPTLQAASRAFMGAPCLPPGKWERLSEWLGLVKPSENRGKIVDSPAVHKIEVGGIRAFLRGVRFRGRPAHADQLHLDLWWDGHNIALDPGTFAYNDAPPWKNPLDATRAHNTLTIDDRDQMVKTGKFLWLQQAEATFYAEARPNVLVASQDGYKEFGISHLREVSVPSEDDCQVLDQVFLEGKKRSHQVTLHWLLPAWNWRLDGATLTLVGEDRQIQVQVSAAEIKTGESVDPVDVTCIVGGETLAGTRSDPILGWVSDTYGQKKPTLSWSIQFQFINSTQIVTDWRFVKNPPKD